MAKAKDIKGRIADLLALSNSPEPEEARAAMLKARELMAKHKLSPEDCKKEPSEIIEEVLPFTCTAMTNPWAAALATSISPHYCCEAYRIRAKRQKRVRVGLVGRKDDYQICKRVILYAYERVMSYCEYQICRNSHDSAKANREKCNAYGWGFIVGLLQALEDQQAKHQEWGLVMVVPQEVHARLEGMKSSSWGKVDRNHMDYMNQGFHDGKRFRCEAGEKIAPVLSADQSENFNK